MALALFLSAQSFPPLNTVSALYQCSSRQVRRTLEAGAGRAHSAQM